MCADNTLALPLPELTVVRGAEEPLSRLQAHIRSSTSRVLILAESDGRRESLLDFVRSSGLTPPVFDSLQEFLSSEEKIGMATAALVSGFHWFEHNIDLVTETELFAAGAVTRRRKKQEQVSDVEALIKDLSELNVGDPVVHSAHGIGRYRGLVNMDMGQKNEDGTPALQEFLHLEYADKATLVCAREPAAADWPLHGRERRRSAAAQAGLRPMGKSQTPRRRASARRRRRVAQHLRPPRCTRGPSLSATARKITKPLPTTLALKKPPTKRPPSTASFKT